MLSSLASVMSASFLVQFSAAAITTMIAVQIAQTSGSQSDVALIAASYSLGFLAGCFLSPKHIQRLGFIRAYSAAATLCGVAMVLMTVFDSRIAWAGLRFLTGISMAAVLAVAETWINMRTPSEKRGRVLAIYTILLGVGALLSQAVFLLIDYEDATLFVVFAVLVNIAVIVVSFTYSDVPIESSAVEAVGVRLRVTSVTSVVGVFFSGFMVVSLVSVVPFYMSSHGVSDFLVAVAMSALYLGWIALQWPIGSVSDHIDRRIVIAGIGLGITLLMTVFWVMLGGNAGEGRYLSGEAGFVIQGLFVATLCLLGGLVYPLYSVASALSFDRASDAPPVEVAMTLLAAYYIGTIVGPICVLLMSSIFGDLAILVCTIAASSAVGVTGVWRILSVPAPQYNEEWKPSGGANSIEIALAQAEINPHE